jgi:hypothetical protein
VLGDLAGQRNGKAVEGLVALIAIGVGWRQLWSRLFS